MKNVHAVKAGIAVASTVLIMKVVHLALYMLSPELFAKLLAQMTYLVNVEKYRPDFAFSWTSFGIETVHCVVGAFVATWLVMFIYKKLIK